MEFQTGDIICVNGDSLFKSIIGWFSRSHNEPKTYAKHIAGLKDNETVSEAVWTVKETSIHEWNISHKQFEVWRKKDISEKDKKIIYDYLNSKHGNIYGGWKLFLFASDFLLTKILRKRKDVYLFRKLGFIEDFPICSWLYAYAYDNIGYRFGGYEPNRIDPDTMRDKMLKSDEWEMIYKKG